ncbi:MAG: basic amino acid/polyamine antiporter [Burkholderiaceae bacterium]
MSAPASEQLSRGALVALVVGSMVGAGIFTLPAALGRTTGALGATIAWCIAGGGMLMLALVFQNLSRQRPDLDAGIYAYARAGFGNYLGFAAAFGYWIVCCRADLACLLLIKGTLGQYFEVFGDGSTPVAIAGASAILWGVHLPVLRGVRQAAALNALATVAKVAPLAIFIVVVALAFRTNTFALNFWGDPEAAAGSVASQVGATMLVTVFVFVGIEGASVYSRYARNRADVGVATVLGFLVVLALLVSVTLLSYGILLRADLAALPNPSMGGVLETVVGPWGRLFVSIGLLIAVAGNYLSWSLLGIEVLHSAGKSDTMPRFLPRSNAHGVPHRAQLMTNLAIQAFLIVTWFAESAFTIALKMTSAMTLLPYLLVAAYGFKLAWTGETYGADDRSRRLAQGVAALASAYAATMLWAAGAKYLLLAALLYAPGTALFFYARREQRERVFARGEVILFMVFCGAAVAAPGALASGALTL